MRIAHFATAAMALLLWSAPPALAEPQMPVTDGQALLPDVKIINPAAEEAAKPAGSPVTVPAAIETAGPTPAPAEPAASASPSDSEAPSVSSPASAAVAPAAAQEGGSAAPQGASSEPQSPAAAAAPEAAQSETKPEAAAATPPPPPEPTLAISINLSSQRMTVTENGKAKYTWAISSGRSGYVTPTGTFRPVWMSKMWYSRKYDYAPMPHAIFFHGGTAIHATYATGMLGRPASHGCVRLAPGNAKTLFSLVNKHGKGMTRIVVHGSPRHREPAVAYKKGSKRYATAYRQPYGMPGAYAYSYSQPYYSAPAKPGKYGKPRRYVSRGYTYSGY